jgi:hypothetical protein
MKSLHTLEMKQSACVALLLCLSGATQYAAAVPFGGQWPGAAPDAPGARSLVRLQQVDGSENETNTDELDLLDPTTTAASLLENDWGCCSLRADARASTGSLGSAGVRAAAQALRPGDSSDDEHRAEAGARYVTEWRIESTEGDPVGTLVQDFRVDVLLDGFLEIRVDPREVAEYNEESFAIGNNWFLGASSEAEMATELSVRRNDPSAFFSQDVVNLGIRLDSSGEPYTDITGLLSSGERFGEASSAFFASDDSFANQVSAFRRVSVTLDVSLPVDADVFVGDLLELDFSLYAGALISGSLLRDPTYDLDVEANFLDTASYTLSSSDAAIRFVAQGEAPPIGVPEPALFGLLVTGLAAAGLTRGKRRSARR